MSTESKPPPSGPTTGQGAQDPVAALTREVEQLRAERDRAVQARDALIREVLPLSRPRPDAPRRRVGMVGLATVVIVGLIGVVVVQHVRTMRQLSDEGHVRREPAAPKSAPASPALRAPLVRPTRVEVIPVRGIPLLGRAALSPDGRQVAVAGSDGQVGLVDLADDRLTLLRAHTAAVRDVVYDPGGRFFVTGGADGAIRLWAPTGRPLRDLRASGAPVRGLAVSRGAPALLAVAAEEPTVRLYPLSGAAAPRALDGHKDWVRAVAFSPDGARLASGGHDRQIRLWDVAAGRLAHTLSGHTLWVSALAFSPDGRRLASAGIDRRLLLWDTEQGVVLHRLRGHSREAVALAFGPAGALASASLDRTGMIFDAVHGTVRATLAGHRWMVSSVAFDPQGRFVLTASGDGTLRLWPLPLPQPPVTEPLPPAGPRDVTLRNNTTGERLRVALLDDEGEVQPAAAARLAEFLRCGPDDRAAALDPALVQLVDAVAARFGRDRELVVVSGYRSPAYNTVRTTQSREVAKESQHLEGKAIDVRVEGVTIMALRDFLKRRRAGGVGFYPDSNFVHMDTGRVRSWSGE